MATHGPDTQAIERWFVRRGLPHFIADYSAGSDIWTRSLGTMTLIYLAGGIGNGLHKGWGVGGNAAAALGSLGILMALMAVVNLCRGRRLLEAPTEVGLVELGLVAVGPLATALVFGFQWRSGLVVSAGLVLVLAAVYIVTSYGLIPMTRWALGRLVDQVAAIGGLLARALPLLLLFVTFLFINAEVWQVAGQLYGAAYVAVVVLFFVIGAGFVIGRLPVDVAEIGHFDSWDDCAQAARATPASAVPVPHQPGAVDPQLTRRQWVNVGLVLAFSQGVVITLVALVTGLFFVLFGFIAIPASTAQAWLASETPVHELSVFGVHVAEPLLRVAGFLAAFTGLYFTVYLVTDETYRREFRGEIVGEVREAFAARALYLADTIEPAIPDLSGRELDGLA